MKTRLLPLLLLLLPAMAGAITIAGRDMGGQNLICGPGSTAGNSIPCSPNDVLSGVFTNVGLFQVNAGTTVFVTPATPLVIFASTISIPGLLNGSGRGEVGGIGGDPGQPGGDGSGRGPGIGANANKGGGAGAYGGNGGNGAGTDGVFGIGGAAYDDTAQPVSYGSIALGSGGGGGGGTFPETGGSGGQGGASIYLESSSFTLTGTIFVRGVPGGNATKPADAGGGGAGGGLLLRCADLATVHGTINASGGKGGDATGADGNPGGGGGGGRVKIYYREAIFSVAISTEGGPAGSQLGPGSSGLPLAVAGSPGTASFATVASPPSGLLAPAVFATSITWNWAAAPDWGNAAEASRNYRLYSGTVSYHTPDRSPQLVVPSDAVSAVETGLTPNTAYSRYATAFTDNSDSLPSNIVSTYTLAGLPGAAASTFTDVTAVSLNLNWSAGSPANPGYTSYEVTRSTGTNFGLAVSTSFVTALSSAPAGLAPNTTYYFRVRAINLDNVPTGFSPAVSTATLALAPVAPSFSQVSSASLVFNWNGAGNPPGTLYIAEISTDNFSTLSRSSGTLNTGAAFTGLAVNDLYYARVKAQNQNGVDTAFTAAVSTYTDTALPLNAAVLFTNLSPEAFTFNWTSGGNSAGVYYNPEISTSSDFSAPVSSDVSVSLNYDFMGLSANTTYYAHVRALGADGTPTPYAATVSTVTLTLAPAPLASPFSGITTNSFSFTWSPGGNPPGTIYAAEISRNSFATLVSSAATTELNAAWPGLTPNTVYQARVKAVSFLGADGPYSSPIRSTATLTTVPLNAEQPFTSVSAAAVTFTWADGGNPGGTSYTVELSSAGFAAGTAISSAATLALSQTFSGLLPNTTYYGRARAVNMDNVPGGYSPAVAVVTLPLPAVPGSPPFSGVNSSGLTLGWTANGNPQNTEYVAEISLNNFVSISHSSTTLGLTAAFTGLTPNTTYTARIKPLNFAGSAGPYSTPVVSTATLAVAPQPAGLPISLTETGFTAQWSGGGNPAGTRYEAEVSTRPDFSPQWAAAAVADLGGSFALAPNTTYYARVRARNHNGIPSADLSIGAGLTYAAAPAVLASTAAGFVSVTTFSFTSAVSTGTGGLLFYRTVWDRNPTHAWNDQEPGWTGLAVITTTATGNGYWYLHLRSYNFKALGYKTADIGPFQISISTILPPGQPVPAPGAFTATSGITWNWPPAIAFGDTAISTYVVSVGTSPAFFSVLVDYAAGPLTSFTLDPAVNGQTYYLKVRAVDEGGSLSQYSPVSSPGVLVDRTTPERLGPVRTDRKFSYDSTVLFSWSAAADAESGLKSYLLDVGTSLRGSDILNAENTGLEPSYQATGLPSGKSVFARVRAENNAGGISDYSDPGPGVPVWTLDQAPPMTEPYNWPNPFDPAAGPTQIGFFLAAPAKVTLKLFTLEGNLVLEETRAEGAAGNKTWPWAGRNGAGKMVAPGGYICVVEKRYGGKTERQQFKLAVLY